MWKEDCPNPLARSGFPFARRPCSLSFALLITLPKNPPKRMIFLQVALWRDPFNKLPGWFDSKGVTPSLISGLGDGPSSDLEKRGR